MGMYTEIKIQNEVKNETKFIKRLVNFTSDCVRFWNREGAKVYCDNLTGKIGSKESNANAKKTEYPTWLLDRILIDINTLKEENGHLFKAGRTSSHVWVHTLEGEEERVLMLYTE